MIAEELIEQMFDVLIMHPTDLEYQAMRLAAITAAREYLTGPEHLVVAWAVRDRGKV